MKRIIILSVSAIILLVCETATTRSFRVDEIPNGSVNSCSNCHTNPNGGGSNNAFGTAVETNFLNVPGPTGRVQWGSSPAALDSDGDGYTNGQELQDISGAWEIGNPQPGNSDFVSNPGSASSIPITTNIVNTEVEIFPEDYILGQNYPNPFNPFTHIDFSLIKSQNVSLIIYNSLGETVRVFENKMLNSGRYSIQWDGRDESGNQLSSGIYLYRLSLENSSRVRKMTLLK